MKKRFALPTTLMLSICFLVGCTVEPYQYYEGDYTFSYVNSLSASFETKIRKICMEYGIFLEDFMAMEALPYNELDSRSRQLINEIRNKIDTPEPDMLLSKVVAKSELENYLNERHYLPRGFITRAADSKEYRSLSDYYYGLRMDYDGTAIDLKSDDYIGVFRFTIADTSSIYVPRCPENGGTITDSFPFTGHGFTSGTRVLGSPEWYLPGGADFESGELWAVYANGTEQLLAVYNEDLGYFVSVE